MSRARTAVAVTVALSAACAAVGALRYIAERRQLRTGSLPRSGSDVVIAPPTHEDPLSGLVARWVPRRPRTRGGRVLASIWAAPLTAVGVVLAMTTGGTWQRGEGCWIVSGGDRGAARLQRHFGFAGNAVGQIVLVRPTAPSPALLAHETTHVRQAERLGVMIVPLYAVLFARWGYRRHPMERAARHGAARSAGQLAGDHAMPRSS